MALDPHFSRDHPGQGLDDETLPTTEHAAVFSLALILGVLSPGGEGCLFQETAHQFLPLVPIS